MNIDVNKIINGTPYKRILNGYNLMKENYSKESADIYYDVYSKENLSDILENSKLIFSEPYRGLDFYKSIVLESSSCIFTELKNEFNKVNSFLTENENKMPDSQKELYSAFVSDFKKYIESVDDIILVSSYLKSRENNNFEKELSNIIYNEKKNDNVNIDNIINYIKESSDLRSILVYTPFIYETVESGGKLNSIIEEKTSDIISNESWTDYVLNTVIMNRLRDSVVYNESVNANVHNQIVKSIFRGLMESDIESILNKIRTESVKDNNIVLHETSHSAINSLYVEKLEQTLFADEIKEEKEKNDKYLKEAYDAVFDLISYEYQESEDETKQVSGYSFVEDNVSLEKSYLDISSKLASLTSEDESFFEESEDDYNDDDIDKQINDLSNDDKEASNTSTSSHIKAPKTGNVVNRIQTKAQDNNVKTLKTAGKLKKVGQDIGNAAKAVAKLPIAFMQGLKNEIHKLDTMDDERRKRYITAPGYRKSIIKKLHLALLYGGAAATNLALIPVVMTYRHFSKIKDKRMRAEAIRDLEAEIKVCDAKIEDAQQSDDKAQRYQLIRIREKLNGELVRVTTNSKYT